MIAEIEVKSLCDVDMDRGVRLCVWVVGDRREVVRVCEEEERKEGERERERDRERERESLRERGREVEGGREDVGEYVRKKKGENVCEDGERERERYRERG